MIMQSVRDLPDLFNQSIRFFPAHLPILPISTANPLTPRLSRSPRLIPSRLIIVSQGDGGEDFDSLWNPGSRR